MSNNRYSFVKQLISKIIPANISQHWILAVILWIITKLTWSIYSCIHIICICGSNTINLQVLSFDSIQFSLSWWIKSIINTVCQVSVIIYVCAGQCIGHRCVRILSVVHVTGSSPIGFCYLMWTAQYSGALSGNDDKI